MGLISWINRQRKKKPMEAWVQLNQLVGIGDGFTNFFEGRITSMLALVTMLGVFIKGMGLVTALLIIVPAYFFYAIVIKGLIIGKWLEKGKILQEQAKYQNHRNTELMDILKSVKRIERRQKLIEKIILEDSK